MAAKDLTDFERISRTKKYKTLRASLIEQLERGGNDTPHFLDLVEDYMKMYVAKELCGDDIKAKGVSITSIGSTGQTTIKKNESVDLLIRTNAQMLKVLDKLGIATDGEASEDEEF